MKTQETSISAEQVAAYLKENPTFFTTNEAVIADLELEHKTGDGTASLMQRQVSSLRTHLSQNRERLAELARNAKHNESLLHRFQELAVSLASAKNTNDAATLLQRVVCANFGLDFLAIIAAENTWGTPCEHVIEASKIDFTGLTKATDGLSIFLGKPPTVLHGTLLAEQKESTQSIALVSIMMGENRGYVLIGSKEADHFHSEMGTEFVKFLGKYVSAVLTALLSV